ncbi:MAG TPA: hypothetical protein ENI82_02490 [Bacteroidetes bacterium]|nr:hypothetical protein [Bacteroidota bacterium]
MKKMNLNFFGLTKKIVLPLFILFGLIFLSVTNVQAQSSLEDKLYAEEVSNHINQLPSIVSLTLPTTKMSKKVLSNPQKANEAKIALEKKYGELIIAFIKRDTKSEDAIDNAYSLLNAKVSSDFLDPVREIYRQMLNN